MYIPLIHLNYRHLFMSNSLSFISHLFPFPYVGIANSSEFFSSVSSKTHKLKTFFTQLNLHQGRLQDFKWGVSGKHPLLSMNELGGCKGEGGGLLFHACYVGIGQNLPNP